MIRQSAKLAEPISKERNMLLSFIKGKKISEKSSLYSIKAMMDTQWNLSKTFPVTPEDRNAEAVAVFNRFFTRLNTVVSGILKNVVGLSGLAPELSRFSKGFKDRIQDQEKKAGDISKAAGQMAWQIDQIALKAGSVSEDAVSIETEVGAALKLGTDSMEQFSSIQRHVTDLVEIASVLEERSKTITSIIHTMNTISDETAILSLNARIEAAKTDSDKNGFTVIAREIGDLSKQSGAATKRIKEQLDVLMAKINETVEHVKMVENDVGAGEKMITNANASLADVHGHIRHLSTSMAAIQETMVLQSRDVSRVSSDIQAMEEFVKLQSSGVQKIFNAASQIHTRCDEMMVDTGIFHLSGHDRAGEAAKKMAEDLRILSFDRALQEKALAAFMAENSFIELSYITNRSGKQVVENQYASGVENAGDLDGCFGRDWSDTEWFQQPFQTRKMFISTVYRSSATQCFCFTVAVPLFNADGFSGVLGIDINVRDMLCI